MTDIKIQAAPRTTADSREYITSMRLDARLASDRVLDLLPWLKPRTLSEFLPHVPALGPRGEYDVDFLKQASRDFHRRAGTLTAAVENRIREISDNNLVRLSHQPNLFAYAKQIGQFVALETMAGQINGTVPLYYFIDYDAVGNNRFRQANVPDPTHPVGIRHVSLPGRHQRTAVANAAGVPTRDWLRKTGLLLQALGRSYETLELSDAPTTHRVQRLLTDIDVAADGARNVADFCAILISRYVSLWLELPIVFVPGSILWSNIAARAMRRELPHISEIQTAVGTARRLVMEAGIVVAPNESELVNLPWWKTCSCGSRLGLRLSVKGAAEGTCPHCHLHHSLELDADAMTSDLNSLSPRILCHSMLNTTSFGYRTGVSHVGSAEHIIVHSIALLLLGRTPLVQWLWECRGPFLTALEQPSSRLGGATAEARSLVETGSASFIYFALCQSSEKLRHILHSKLGDPGKATNP